jgi:integrase
LGHQSLSVPPLSWGLVKPNAENRTVVTPVRRPNAELRTREYLTDDEVDRLVDVAKGNRHGHRDATMILMAYRHGFRVSELVDLRWDQIDFDTANLAVRRVKKGSLSTHHILGDELRALRRLNLEQEPKSPFVFTSERLTCYGTPVDSPWPIRAMIRGLCRHTWGIRTFSTRCVGWRSDRANPENGPDQDRGHDDHR